MSSIPLEFTCLHSSISTPLSCVSYIKLPTQNKQTKISCYNLCSAPISSHKIKTKINYWIKYFKPEKTQKILLIQLLNRFMNSTSTCYLFIIGISGELCSPRHEAKRLIVPWTLWERSLNEPIIHLQEEVCKIRFIIQHSLRPWTSP